MASTTSLRSIKASRLAMGMMTPCRAGEAALGQAEIVERLDLLVEAAHRLDAALLVDAAGDGELLP
jgi:hypothetical protein